MISSILHEEFFLFPVIWIILSFLIQFSNNREAIFVLQTPLLGMFLYLHTHIFIGYVFILAFAYLFWAFFILACAYLYWVCFYTCNSIYIFIGFVLYMHAHIFIGYVFILAFAYLFWAFFILACAYLYWVCFYTCMRISLLGMFLYLHSHIFFGHFLYLQAHIFIGYFFILACAYLYHTVPQMWHNVNSVCVKCPNEPKYLC